jgi:hypothetical protein
MAEQSSTVVAFRALVMLICLILIPVAAFCGGSFPAIVKAIQSGSWPTLTDFRGPSGPPLSQATEAPRFLPGPLANSPRAADAKLSALPNDSNLVLPAETPQSPVLPISYTSPVASHESSDPGQSTSFPQSKSLGIAPSRGLSPVPPGAGNLLSLDHAATTGHPSNPALPTEPAGSMSPSDQFKYIQDRLRHLGATYYLLETCGDPKREFRFYCRMSIGGNPRVTKPFWCFAGDPLNAMTQVLKQVEDWQSGGG